MQLSGSMTRKFGPSWKQSTGHTSTQSVCLQLMQFSVTTWVTVRRAVGDTHSLAAPIAPGHDLDQGVSVAPARSSGLALYARRLLTDAAPAFHPHVHPAHPPPDRHPRRPLLRPHPGPPPAPPGAPRPPRRPGRSQPAARLVIASGRALGRTHTRTNR